jgi:hypothetical protein
MNNVEIEQVATQLIQNGNPAEASSLLQAALREAETSDRWNDWAAAETACGRTKTAELGFRRALQMNPTHRQASVNLATLLIASQRHAEAVPILEPHAASLTPEEKSILARLAGAPADAGSQPADPLPPPSATAPVAAPDKVQPGVCAVPNGETAWQEFFYPKTDGQQPRRIGASFYRGENCNFNPYGKDHASPAFCRDFILRGHLPESKIISRSTKVTAFGSCFALHVSRHLSSLRFDVSKDRAPDIYISSMGEGLVNVHALLQQFTWALEGEQPPENLWHGFDAATFGYDEKVRAATREVFLNTDVFILTLGLSEVWYDEVTGGILWRAVPLNLYDPSRHKFRVCSVAETRQALTRIYGIIRRHVPQAKIVITLSPIALAATFRPESCITANSASKAILKAALDEFLREVAKDSPRRAYYFPAFEIVNELFPNRFEEDGRHLHKFIVPAVMKIFEAYYCETELTPAEAEAALRAARIQSATAPAMVHP